MRVEVVAVGTELLLGQIVDTNSSWIGGQLALVGLNSHYQTKVGDNPARIREVIELALRRSDAVICCGGLGPTQDDLTREVIAELMGVHLVRDESIVERITAMFAGVQIDAHQWDVGEALFGHEHRHAAGVGCTGRNKKFHPCLLHALTGCVRRHCITSASSPRHP